MVGGSSQELTRRKAARERKSHLCGHCDRRFARREHLARHERTHTKEKPYSCATCSQCFTRSDLLVRHDRLFHQSPGRNTTGGSSREFESSNERVIAPVLDSGEVQQQDLFDLDHGTASGQADSDLLNHADHLAPPLRRNDLFPISLPTGEAMSGDNYAPAEDIDGSVQDFVLMPSDMDIQMDAFSFNFNEDGIFGQTSDPWGTNVVFPGANLPLYLMSEQPVPFITADLYDMPRLPSDEAGLLQPSRTHAEHNVPLSIIDINAPTITQADDTSRKACFSDVTSTDRKTIIERLKKFEHVLPNDFVLPSRIALSRYFSAFIGGFHEHMPFLHVPTTTVPQCSIELLMAIATAGAFYRFETAVGEALFYASDSIATELMRISNDAETKRLTRIFHDHRGKQNQESNPYSGSSVSGATSGPQFYAEEVVPASNISVETLQALLLLMAVGTWSKHELFLRRAVDIHNTIARLTQSDGLAMQSPPSETTTWETWAKYESAKRTKLIVFCFFNLRGLIYDSPSPITTSDLLLDLPCTMSVFEAKTRREWNDARAQMPCQELPFQTSLRQLFSKEDSPVPPKNSSLGNYVLIHALLQQVFTAAQLSCYQSYQMESTSNSPSNYAPLIALERALGNWQRHWQANSDASVDVSGPIPFTSIALLRLAYIRLNVDFGPTRALQSRTPSEIARGLSKQRPYPRRGRPQLLPAVLHAAHALSVPIKIGVTFVAQTHAVFWSVQHCLCSLECAVLLSSWLHDLSAQGCTITSLTVREQRIIQLVALLLAETEYTITQGSAVDLDDSMKLNKMAAAVVRVWSKTFTAPLTWPLLDIIGQSLEIYAQLLDNDNK